MTAHPDLDLLSALVDGIDEDATAAHVATCPACADQVDAMRRAARAVAEVPEPPASEMDAALAAAMAAVADRPARSADGTVVPRRARARRPLPGWVLAAAAAVLVVALAVPIVRSLGGEGSHKASTAATAGTIGDSATGDVKAQSGSSALATAGGSTVGAPVIDVGAVDDPATLRARLAPFAPGSPATGPASATAGSPAAATPGAPGSERDQSAPAVSASPAPAPTSCNAAASTAAGVPGAAPQLTAFAVWRGTLAFVLVYTRPDGSRAAAVVSRAACGPLEVVTL